MRRGGGLVDLVAAAPDLLLGGMFFVAWVEPRLIGADRIRDGLLLMLMEFIVIHSAAFMGTVAWGTAPAGSKARNVIGLGLFYTLFVAGFALAFRSWWPLLGFWGLTLNRLLGALIGQGDGEEKQLVQRGWAATAVFYLLAVFTTVLIPYPRLGVTPEVLGAIDLPGSGAWIDTPWRVMAAGGLYFLACGVSEFNRHHWFAAGKPGPVESAG
jgi:hypothetical protein